MKLAMPALASTLALLCALPALASTLALLCALPAQAASSDWYQTEGGRVRLVATGAPDADGHMRAALQIDLAPGWKTYWRDPGDAGVPPQVAFPEASGVETAEIGFPVPTRFEDPTSQWAGYEWPVSLALTLKFAKDTEPAELEADVFLGICQTICIPVQAALKLDPTVRADDMFDRALVDAAFDSVPRPASAAFGVTGQHVDGKYLVVDVKAPEDHKTTLFLAGDGDFQFGEPKRVEGTSTFKTKLVSTPSKSGATSTINYTLTSGDAAVQGTFVLP